jgi:hypothetical protein
MRSSPDSCHNFFLRCKFITYENTILKGMKDMDIIENLRLPDAL